MRSASRKRKHDEPMPRSCDRATCFGRQTGRREPSALDVTEERLHPLVEAPASGSLAASGASEPPTAAPPTPAPTGASRTI